MIQGPPAGVIELVEVLSRAIRWPETQRERDDGSGAELDDAAVDRQIVEDQWHQALALFDRINDPDSAPERSGLS